MAPLNSTSPHRAPHRAPCCAKRSSPVVWCACWPSRNLGRRAQPPLCFALPVVLRPSLRKTLRRAEATLRKTIAPQRSAPLHAAPETGWCSWRCCPCRCLCVAKKHVSEDGCQLLCKRNHYCDGPWDSDNYRKGDQPDNDMSLIRACPGLSTSPFGSSSIKNCSCPVTFPSLCPPRTAPLQSRRDVSVPQRVRLCLDGPSYLP